MARKKTTKIFKVNICDCGHGEDLHKKGGFIRQVRLCLIKGCKCAGYKFARSETRTKEVFE